MYASSLTGKLIFEGKIKLTSPLIIGSGKKDDNVDIVVIRDTEGKPYIPATSIVGSMKHFYDEHVGRVNGDEYFWGIHKLYSENSGCQSALYIRDLYLHSTKYNISIRDGIKIDNQIGITKEKAKYDYEILEPGVIFNFYGEVTIRKEYNKEVFMKIISYLLQALSQGKIYIGAKTTRGFGRVKLIDCAFYDLDFSNKEHVLAWLSKSYKKINTIDIFNFPTFETTKNNLLINGNFIIKNSLMIGSDPKSVDEPDKVHINYSKDKPIIPGTSLAGALRNRAETIINTISLKDNDIVKCLFGYTDKNEKSKRKSKIYVQEKIINNGIYDVQMRNKIDRFTGGTITNALFDEDVLWSKNNTFVNIDILVKDCEDIEVGLLLLVIKDLWNADLPIGGEKNIGRGVFKGQNVIIKYKGDELSIEKTNDGIKISGNQEKFEEYVSNLVTFVRGD